MIYLSLDTVWITVNASRTFFIGQHL